MDTDDPRQPLLGEMGEVPVSRFRRVANKFCSVGSWKRRLPITIWLPKYKLEYLLRDAIAGITVGLTSIPQGIAYAMVAGLPPQVGLYSSIFPGLVYMFLGSCSYVTVGPTAIISALVAKYVAKSKDFAFLASFLSGFVILILGVLQLGFLLDFVSKPVISAFTTAAALQIGAAQLKSLFHIDGSSGDTFIAALTNFFKHITTIQLWDTVLGVVAIILLLLIKRVKVEAPTADSPRRVLVTRVVLYVVRARNALVVFGATLLAYLLALYDLKPFALTGKIHGGLPDFGPPPFSTVVNNQTLNFEDMLTVFGPEGFVIPLVAVLESIAIAKAFAGSGRVDGTQEMVAIGACNILASFAQCMPATGSFTRTALNHASGVVTTAGAFFKASLVFLAVTLLADAFYFIPRCTLAAVIMVAMMSIVEFAIILKLWRNNKLELLVYVVTLVVGVVVGLEYGILAGCVADVLRVLAAAARPHAYLQTFKVGHLDCTSISLQGSLSYASAEYIVRTVRKHAQPRPAVVVLDARHLTNVDIGVAENLILTIQELEHQYCFLVWNLSEPLQKLFLDLQPQFQGNLVSGPSIDQHVLGLSIRSDHRDNIYTAF